MSNVFAAKRVVNLEISYKTVNFAGKPRKAIAVNNQIPAPSLHFKKGDQLTINVHNKLDQETAVHWHGIILPWQMDGVLGISQQGIPPGGVFHYQFTLNQSGTYWYHAHAGLQEQQGFYGAFLIDPPQHPSYKYTKDYVVVLSDWSNTYPDKILSNLKKEGDYYSSHFPLQPSLVKFIHDYKKASPYERKQLVNDYKMMQQMRMGIYDFSDVAYDAFLLNGQMELKPWTALVKVGDIVRLRFIGAGGSTIFRIKVPGTSMQVVHVDGNDVKPYTIQDLTIAPGETYDVLVKIQKNAPYIIYAQSIDTVGAAYGALVTSSEQVVNYKQVMPFPEPLPVTREMISMMMINMKRGSLPDTKTNKSTFSKTDQAYPINMKINSASQPMTLVTMDSSSTLENLRSDKIPMSHTENNHTNHKIIPGMPIDSSLKTDKNMPISSSHVSAIASNAKINGNIKIDHSMPMDHADNLSMPTEPTVIGDKMSPPTFFYTTSSGTKYENLVAAIKTNNPNKPIACIINMELFGYMDRYIWFINGTPEDRAHPIVLKPGKRYRFVFTNTSMMHHPMHIHGHWFILRKGNGAYDPLLHTIDVAPGATITADVDTDASGQWIFHCHFLYHMVTGMARTFQYSTLIEITKNEVKPQDIAKKSYYYNRPIVRVDEAIPLDASLVKHPIAHLNSLWFSIPCSRHAHLASDELRQAGGSGRFY